MNLASCCKVIGRKSLIVPDPCQGVRISRATGPLDLSSLFCTLTPRSCFRAVVMRNPGRVEHSVQEAPSSRHGPPPCRKRRRRIGSSGSVGRVIPARPSARPASD